MAAIGALIGPAQPGVPLPSLGADSGTAARAAMMS